MLAVLALGTFAPVASGAVLRVEFEDCACDPSSGDVGSTTLVVRAAPGEVNRMSVVGTASGPVVVRDDGAPLQGCEPAPAGGWSSVTATTPSTCVASAASWTLGLATTW